MNRILHSDNSHFPVDDDLSVKVGKWICENYRAYDIQHIRDSDYKNYILNMPIVLQTAAVNFGYAPAYIAKLMRSTLSTSDPSLFQRVTAIFKLQEKANDLENNSRFLAVKNVIRFFYESGGGFLIDDIHSTYIDYPERQMARIMGRSVEIAGWLMSQYKQRYIQKFDSYHWDTAQANMKKLRLLGRQYDLVLKLLRDIVEIDLAGTMAVKILESHCTKQMIVDTIARHACPKGACFNRFYKQAIDKLEWLKRTQFNHEQHGGG